MYNLRFTYLLLFSFLISAVTAFSQGTDVRYGQQKHFYIGINISPAQTAIKNDATLTISQLRSTKRSSCFSSLEAGYFFSRYIGVSTGIGYSSFKTNLSLDSYSVSYDTTDSESESYERRISGEDIKEIQTISCLSVPILLNIQTSVNKKFGAYLQAGMNFSFPLGKKYSSSGTFTYSGFYPAYNVLITDIPYEGFQSDVQENVDGKLNIKTMIPELITSAGFFLTLQNKFQISLGMFYNRCLSDISKNSNSDSFILSSLPNHIRSMMGGSTNVSANSVGIKLSLKLYLR